jgi:hypothetical protein
MYEKETVALVLKSVLSKVGRDAWRKGSECICQGICSVGLIEAAMQTQKDVVVFCKKWEVSVSIRYCCVHSPFWRMPLDHIKTWFAKAYPEQCPETA